MNKRDLIVFIAGLFTGYTTNQHTGDVSIPDNINKSRILNREDAGLNPTFPGTPHGFRYIQFAPQEQGGWETEIHFGGHDMDGFGIRHVSQGDYSDDIIHCGAPASTGVRTVPFHQRLQNYDVVYPDRRFNLIAYEGPFDSDGCSGDYPIDFRYAKELGQVNFRLPEQLAPSSSFENVE